MAWRIGHPPVGAKEPNAEQQGAEPGVGAETGPREALQEEKRHLREQGPVARPRAGRLRPHDRLGDFSETPERRGGVTDN